MAIKFSRAEVERTLSFIQGPRQIREVRILNALIPSRKEPCTLVGYFDADHIDDLFSELDNVTTASCVYFTLNPVHPDLQASACNQLKPLGKGGATSDSDIVRREYLLFDVNPIRTAGITSSDDEHAAAIAKGREIKDALSAEGWPKPLLSDSGNGCHLIYRIDLPTNDEGLIEEVLKAVAVRFDSDTVTIDTGVANPARICKLYGTLVLKDRSTLGRPLRMSRIIEMPSETTPVPLEMLEAVAATGFDLMRHTYTRCDPERKDPDTARLSSSRAG